MKFRKENHSLMWKHQYETVCITPWGLKRTAYPRDKIPQFYQTRLGARRTCTGHFPDVSIELNCGENTQNPDASIVNASITNGRLCIKVDAAGIMTFTAMDKESSKNIIGITTSPPAARAGALESAGGRTRLSLAATMR